jgi:hypothetical protein
MASKVVEAAVANHNQRSILGLQISDWAGTRSSFKVDREVIAYDYVKRKLTRELKVKIEGMVVVLACANHAFIDLRVEMDYLETDLPGSRTRCDVYIQDNSSHVRTYFATVDLSQMSWSVAWKRRRGLISKLYIVGQNPDEAMSHERK